MARSYGRLSRRKVRISDFVLYAIRVSGLYTFCRWQHGLAPVVFELQYLADMWKGHNEIDVLKSRSRARNVKEHYEYGLVKSNWYSSFVKRSKYLSRSQGGVRVERKKS